MRSLVFEIRANSKDTNKTTSQTRDAVCNLVCNEGKLTLDSVRLFNCLILCFLISSRQMMICFKQKCWRPMGQCVYTGKLNWKISKKMNKDVEITQITQSRH